MIFIIVPINEKPTEKTNHKKVLTKNLRLKRVCMGRKIPQKIRKHPTPMTIQLHPQCLLGIQGILRNWTFLIFKQV